MPVCLVLQWQSSQEVISIDFLCVWGRRDDSIVCIAGGYDAIVCIVLSDKAKQDVRGVWESWKELSVGPLLSQADSHGVTCVELEAVPGLSAVLSD